MRLKTLHKRWIYFLVNHVYAGTEAWDRKRHLLRAAGWKIGEGTRIVGPVACSASVEIGADCWIGRDFKVHGNGCLIIGDRCDLGPETAFFTGGHVIGGPERRAGAGESYTIRIGSGCWLGGRSSFLRNVTVGEASVVAACACVTEDVPPYTLTAGVPAREIRRL